MLIRRRYLPHIENERLSYFVTFRLADSLPANVIVRLKSEQRAQASCDTRLLQKKYFSLIERYLDSGEGECVLKMPQAAAILDSALRFFNEKRYHLHAWTIMPNHVHVLLQPFEGFTLSSILHSWKSYTATEVNRALQREGTLWEREYYDRFIRNHRHFEYVARYILNNPVKAGLCRKFYEYPWKGMCEEVMQHMERFRKEFLEE